MWFFCLYLRLALFCGFYRHVCRLVNRWGGESFERDSFRKQAAYRMENILFEKGYPHCPSCHRPVISKDDHLQDKNSWCYEDSLPRCPACRMTRYPDDGECRYCKLDRDIDEGARQAEELYIMELEMEGKMGKNGFSDK